MCLWCIPEIEREHTVLRTSPLIVCQSNVSQDSSGNTALDQAIVKDNAGNDRAEIVAVLRAAGAKEVSLIVAAMNGWVEVVKALVAADPDPAHLDMKVSIP